MARVSCIVEGDGDITAVPNLIRHTAASHGLFQIQIVGRPLRAGNIANLMRAGEYERFVRIASKRDNDVILLLCDADDRCPVDLINEMHSRSEIISGEVQKRIGICFFKPEFEVLFLHDIHNIAHRCPQFGINPDKLYVLDFEGVRDSKGRLKEICSRVRYKETRDQEKLVYALDTHNLPARSRCFRHFIEMLFWIEQEQTVIFPNPVQTG